MKILHLIYDHINNPWIGGGGAVRAYEINKRLAMKRHEILIISGKYPDAEDYEEGNLRFNFLGSDKNYVLSVFSYAFKAIQYLKKHAYDFDIVIEDFAPWNPVFSFKYHKDKIVIVQIQNFLGLEIIKKYLLAGLPFYLCEKFYPFYFRNKIFVSEALSSRFKNSGGVIPNGINFKEDNIQQGDYIAFLGRIDIHQKGLDILIKALSDLKNLNVKIAGFGRDEKRLLKLLKAYNNIEFFGRVYDANKKQFLAKAKFLIMPSRFEGQGIVALEAASMGKPVIVSDIPELKWVVEAGFGISFKNESATDLAEKINFLLQRDDLITEMGKHGIEYAKQFTWDRIAADYETYLLSLQYKLLQAERLSLKQ